MEVKRNLKYPIKYAIMPLEEQVGWDYGERVFDVVAYIVSKCYVIEERKKYLDDGSFEINYEVVFLYARKDNSPYYEFEQAVPNWSIWRKCTNSVFVNELFDSFEEASKVAFKHNTEILRKKMRRIAFDGNFENNVSKINSEYQETLHKYKKIEEKIEQETCDIKIAITSNTTLEDIIDKILKNPSEFYIKLASTLLPQERDYLRGLVENRGCFNCTNGCCRIEHYENVGLDENGKPQGYGCYGWDNYELVGRQKILSGHVTPK